MGTKMKFKAFSADIDVTKVHKEAIAETDFGLDPSPKYTQDITRAFFTNPDALDCPVTSATVDVPAPRPVSSTAPDA